VRGARFGAGSFFTTDFTEGQEGPSAAGDDEDADMHRSRSGVSGERRIIPPLPHGKQGEETL
jgi:hypothetical protein